MREAPNTSETAVVIDAMRRIVPLPLKLCLSANVSPERHNKGNVA